MKRVLIVLLLAFALLVPAVVHADNDARDYIPAPPGTLAILAYYHHTFATDLYNAGKLVDKNYDLSQNVGLFRVVYYGQLGPIVWDPQFIIPVVDVDVKHGVASTTGIGDPLVFATFWFVNDTKSKTWLGFTPFITLPIGQYKSDRALNAGNNRWAFKPELGFVKGFCDRWYFELTGAGEFYTNNDDFTINKVTLSQDPVVTIESHLSFDWTKSFYTSLDYYYHWGGETKIAGVWQDNRQSNHALQLTLGYAFATGYQVLLQYRNDFEVRSGPQSQTVGLRFLYAFDLHKALSGSEK